MSSDKHREPGSQSNVQRLPPLGALRCFEAAARLESFTRAAQELHLTHGAVSRAVRALEEDLGQALFERRSGRVFLTPAGVRLRDGAAEAFAAISAATRELRGRSKAAPLVLSCEPTLLMRWLIPRLPAFQAAHPDMALHLSAAGGPVPFARDGIDLAIRRNDFPFPAGVDAMPIMMERVGPVCSPAVADMLRAASGPERATEIPAHMTLLHTRTRPDAWPRWAELSGVRLRSHAEQRFEHFYFSLQAAAAGLGITIGPWALVQQDIEAGLLVAPFGFLEDGTGYHLLRPSRMVTDGRVEAVITWLQTSA